MAAKKAGTTRAKAKPDLSILAHLEGMPWCASTSVFEQVIEAHNDERSEALGLVLAGLKFPELVRRAESVLARRRGGLVLDSEDALAAGISRADTHHLQCGVGVANKLIADRHVKLGAGFAFVGLTALFGDITYIDKTINGERYILRSELKWYGTRWYISKPLLNKIIQLMAVAGGALGVAAGLQAAGIITAPSAVVTGLIAAIIGLGAAVLVFLDFCNGVYITFPHVGGLPIPTPA